jgi:hypothetical protein
MGFMRCIVIHSSAGVQGYRSTIVVQDYMAPGIVQGYKDKKVVQW